VAEGGHLPQEVLECLVALPRDELERVEHALLERVRRRERLVRDDRPVLVHDHEVGERAPDVDSDVQHGPLRERV
jgi:hypothetical protein